MVTLLEARIGDAVDGERGIGRSAVSHEGSILAQKGHLGEEVVARENTLAVGQVGETLRQHEVVDEVDAGAKGQVESTLLYAVCAVGEDVHAA